jgi:hypothetical protein
MFTRKTNWTAILMTLALCLSACAPLASTPTSAATATAVVAATSGGAATPTPAAEAGKPLLKTALGDFVIASARLTDEVNGVKPQAGEKILLVILARPDQAKLDPTEFSLEAFSNMIHDTSQGEIYILGSDSSQTISTMAGWVGDEFALGFRLPVTAETYTLYWPGNAPINISGVD